MEMLLISFAAAWVIRHWWDGRRADYRNADNDYQRCVGARPARRSGPDTRYALGWSAWQLRHGWPAMADDVRRGWDDANTNYHKWRDGEDTDRGGMFDAWKRGWKQARTKLPKTRRQQAAAADAAPANGGAAGSHADKPVLIDPAPEPQPIPKPTNGTIPTNGDTMTMPTGETRGITAYREHLKTTIDHANRQIEAAQAEIAEADQEVTAHENSHAELTSVGMGHETTGNVAELIEAAQARKDAAQDKLAAAEQAKAQAERSLTDLDQQGHTSVEESVKGATAKVADTSFYEN